MRFLMRNVFTLGLALSVLLGLPVTSPAQAQDGTPVVHAVLFYSPTCPHCEHVIKEDLPPLYETYGDQLQIIGVNTMESEGWALYQAAVERFSIPEDRQGVPTLIVADTVLVGEDEVRNQFPSMIEEGLAAGGIPLPDFPELLKLLPAVPSAKAAHNSVTLEAASLSPMERFKLDPTGNTLSVIVLLGMIASVAYTLVDGRPALQQRLWRANPGASSRAWLVPVLALAGLGVAVYLTYVETLEIRAICGPIGDCNTVQQSKYARLFGALPVGLLGAIGYLGILAMWLWHHIGSDERSDAIASLILFGITGFGTLFSIYLTFLEPFVIGATCVWCLTSAVIITILLLLTARPGLQAIRVLSAQRTRVGR